MFGMRVMLLEQIITFGTRAQPLVNLQILD